MIGQEVIKIILVSSSINTVPQPSFLREDLSYFSTYSSPSFSSILRAVAARYMCWSFLTTTKFPERGSVVFLDVFIALFQQHSQSRCCQVYVLKLSYHNQVSWVRICRISWHIHCPPSAAFSELLVPGIYVVALVSPPFPSNALKHVSYIIWRFLWYKKLSHYKSENCWRLLQRY